MPQAVEISLVFVFACSCLYIFYGRKHNRGEFALLHLLKRVADSRLTDDMLETELREILISRDEIEQDNFDNLIKGAMVSEIEGPLDFDRLLIRLSREIAAAAGMEEEDVLRRYRQRQDEFNTAISDFLAIPHILIDGEDRTFMHIIRCREGVYFSEDRPSVKAVFFMGGTRDNRVLHLKTIASLVTLVQQSSFEEDWMTQKKVADLKSLMLLNKRKRFN